MTRLIDADDLMGRFKELEKRFGCGASGDGIGLCMEELFRADTVEPKQGEWVHELYGQYLSFYKCSNCGFHGDEQWICCPYCGARMKGGDEK